jgi:hypothetical protein
MGMRWRARYVDDQCREHTKAFTRKGDAQSWLDNEVTAKFATGTYVTPEARQGHGRRGLCLVGSGAGPYFPQDCRNPAQRIATMG